MPGSTPPRCRLPHRVLALLLPALFLWGCASTPRGPFANEEHPAPAQPCQELRSDIHPQALEEIVEAGSVMAWFEARRGAPMDGPLAFSVRLPMEESGDEDAEDVEDAEEVDEDARERAAREREANPPMEVLALSSAGFEDAEVAELEEVLEAARQVRAEGSGLPGRVRLVFVPADGRAVASGADEAPVEVVLQPSIQCRPVLLGRYELSRVLEELRRGSIDDTEFILTMFVQRNGRVGNIVAPELEDPPPEFFRVLEMAEEIRFHPALLDGQRRGVWINQPFNMQAHLRGPQGTTDPYR